MSVVKKIIRHRLVLLLAPLICLATSTLAAAPAYSVPHFEPSAEGLSEGWTVVKDGGSTTFGNAPAPTDSRLQLKRTADSGVLSATRSFKPLSGRVVVEARVMTDDREGLKAGPSIYSSSGKCLLSVGLDAGRFVCSDGASEKDAGPFQPGEWYVLRAEIDTKSGTYDLYIDAIRKIQGAKIQTPAAGVARVTFAVEKGAGSDLSFDNLLVYDHADYIGAPPAPVYDVTHYGAVGDGKTLNTVAIQKAIDACAGSGGSVYVPAGVFVSGTIRLKSRMTLFVAPDATLLGSESDDDYPAQDIADFPNAAVSGQRKAFVFADGAKDVTIDGGGTIDGNGGIPRWRMNGGESKRPFLLFPVRCERLTVQNVYFKDSAVWGLVPTECTKLTVRNVDEDSRDYGNRDGIDIVDCKHVLIEDCTLNTDDDTICPKSGIRSGLDDIHVRHCNLMGSGRASGIKFGTLSYGQLKNATFEDILIQNCDKAAIGLESVDGADIAHVTFRRIEITDTNSPFYLIIGTRGHAPAGDVKKIGSIDHVTFEDITGRDLKYNLGCPISGTVVDGRRYPITNLTFRRCDLTFKGGSDQTPPFPPEMGGQYPECNIWGKMPAYGYFLRHADHVSFIDCKTGVSPGDARPWRVTADVTGLADH